MKITRRKIDEIKEHVSIVDVASEYYTLTKNGAGRQAIDPVTAAAYKTISLKEHDSVTIYPYTNSYCRMATGEGGDVLSFLMKMPEINMTFQEAFDYAYQHIDPNFSVEVQKISGRKIHANTPMERIQLVEDYWMENTIQLLKPYVDTGALENQLHTIIKEAKEECRNKASIKDDDIVPMLSKKCSELKEQADRLTFQAQYAKCNFEKFTNAYAYLVQKRKIAPDVVSELLKNKLLRQDSQYGGKYVVFLSTDQDGNYNGLFKRACNHISEKNISRFESIDPSTFKGFLIDHDDTTNTLGIPSKKAMDKRLYVFEANIDMLSYMTLLKEHGMDWKQFAFLSINGVHKYENLFKLLESQPYKEVVVALDNDEPGHHSAKEIKEILDEKGIPNRRICSRNKDWNEDLVKKKEREHNNQTNRNMEKRRQHEESR